jgi:hypothetical protein
MLEKCRRRGTSLENVLGYCTYRERLCAGYRLCSKKKRGKRSHTPLCYRGVLYQEEYQTFGPLLGLVIM